MNAFVIEAGDPGHGQNDAGLGFLPLSGKRFTPGQDEMDSGGPYALDRADRAREFAFHGTGLRDPLLETVGGEAVSPVEDLVSDGAARWQAFLRQQEASAIDLIACNQHSAAAALAFMGDVSLVQLIDDLAGFAQIKITVEQCKRPIVAAHSKIREQTEADHRHSGHRRQTERSQRA